jgi:tartrate dehydratase alpha subunit/fumarate hydratase class I-like protein
MFRVLKILGHLQLLTDSDSSAMQQNNYNHPAGAVATIAAAHADTESTAATMSVVTTNQTSSGPITPTSAGAAAVGAGLGEYNQESRGRTVTETVVRAAVSAVHPIGAGVVVASEVSEAAYHSQKQQFGALTQEYIEAGMNPIAAVDQAVSTMNDMP